MKLSGICMTGHARNGPLTSPGFSPGKEESHNILFL